MTRLIFIFAMLLSMVVAASGAEHGAHSAGHSQGIPAVFYYQIGNLSVLLVILFFLLRKKISGSIVEKKAQFLEKQSSAERARLTALTRKNEMQLRLEKLVSTAEVSRIQAKAEAEAYRQRLQAETSQTEARLQSEALKTESNERARAQSRLRDMLVSKSIQSAREMIKSGLDEKQLRKLQTDFVDKIHVEKLEAVVQ